MSESIESLNKQIASFVLLSAALAVPTISSSANTVNNNLIADASVLMTPSQAVTHEVVAFYAAPQVPQVVISEPTVITGQTPMAFYAAPQVPQVIMSEPIAPNPSPMVFYGAPQTPEIIKSDPTVINGQTPMLFYGAPQTPQVIMSEPVAPSPSPMVFYGAPQIPVNVIEKQVVPTPQNIQQNVNPSQINENGAGGNFRGLKTDFNKNNIRANANMKTEGFVYSEYGNVKIVEPFAHFIFK